MKVWLPSIRSQSGSDVFVERLAEVLSKAGCQVQVSWFPLWNEYLPWGLGQVSPPEGTDIIHANSWSAFAFARAPIPLVVTVHHCVRHTGFPEWKGRLQSLYHDRWIGAFEAKSFSRADAILVGSHSAGLEVEREFELRGRIQTIEYWLDTDRFNPAVSAAALTRRVLWVGNLSSRKGADLLNTFRKMLDPSIELNIVAGRRAQNAGLERLGPKVKVWPLLSETEMIQLYQSCDVTVSLSRHEGFGYTALEAMACGRPVVAFNVTGLRDVVEHGVTGVLCTPDNVREIADACMRLVNDPVTARAMGQAGRRRALTRFSATRAAEQYIELYGRLLTSTDQTVNHSGKK